MRTLDSMRRDGVRLDGPTCQQLLHLFCSSGAWQDALAVMDSLDDAAMTRGAAGGVSKEGGSAGAGGAARPAAAGLIGGSVGGEGGGGAAEDGAWGAAGGGGGAWRQRRYQDPALAPAAGPAPAATAGRVPGHSQLQQPAPARRPRAQHAGAAGAGGEAPARYGLGADALWHIVLRQLGAHSAPDGVTTEFVRRMAPAQLARFARLYPIRRLPGGGFSILPPPRHEASAAPAAPARGSGSGGSGSGGGSGSDSGGTPRALLFGGTEGEAAGGAVAAAAVATVAA